MGRRRAAIAVLLVTVVVLMFGPLIWLEHKAASLRADAAWSALDAYARSQNGDHAYDEAAARALPGFARTPLTGGLTRLGERSASGRCWTIVVGGKGPVAPPAVSPVAQCQ